MVELPRPSHLTCSGCGTTPPGYVVGQYPPCSCGEFEEWRRGDWLQTYTGRMFWPFSSRVEDVDLEDIAIPLSRQCRYGGHCKEFYSVADHSLWVMDRMDPDDHVAQLAALLHDAAEGYLVDVPRPLKHSPEFAAYRAVEDSIQTTIFTWAGVGKVLLDDEMRRTVKRADTLALATEKRDLVVKGRGRWKGVEGIKPHPDPIEPTISMWESARDFISHFKRLHKEIHGQPEP